VYHVEILPKPFRDKRQFFYYHYYYYTRQIRDFSAFSVSSALRHSPSVRCSSAVNDICRLLDIFGTDTVSFEDTFCVRESD
jgi:hypothetical protein